jgi:hypothetical protein
MKIPNIKYHAKGRSSQLGFIEIDGKCVHKIKDIDAFYKEFGYTAEMAMAGILPEEFIWQKYIKDNQTKYTHCLQIHLIEYLKKHSDAFRKQNGAQSDAWIAAHAKTGTTENEICFTCRMQPTCSKHNS